MLLTRELKPFSGGTYFPPTDQPGRAGFLTVLKTMHFAWREQGEGVMSSVERSRASYHQSFSPVGLLAENALMELDRLAT